MTTKSKRVIVLLLSGIAAALCIASLVTDDWLITSAYFLFARRSFLSLLLSVALLPLFGCVWCAYSVIRYPRLWTKRRFIGFSLLLSSLTFLTSLHPLIIFLIGYVGMPYRIVVHPAYLAYLQWATVPTILLATAAFGFWLMRAKGQ